MKFLKALIAMVSLQQVNGAVETSVELVTRNIKEAGELIKAKLNDIQDDAGSLKLVSSAVTATAWKVLFDMDSATIDASSPLLKFKTDEAAKYAEIGTAAEV